MDRLAFLYKAEQLGLFEDAKGVQQSLLHVVEQKRKMI
jgi:hypothetical protein